MNRADILKKFKGVPISYKVLAFLSVIMMTAGAYAVFVSGAAPTADLTPSEIEIYPGESVDFDASGSEGDINSYAWHFHDDNAIEMGDDLTSISHTFSDEGIYHVTLFVNASNAKMDIATSKVVVKNHAPDIVVTQDSYNVNEDEDVTFDASGSTDDSSISSYTWDFGDGDVLYGDVVTHSFTDSGSYNVNLSVEDDRGKSSFKDISVTVQNPVPTADAGDGYGIQEGRPVFLDSSDSMDNPSDTEGIRYRWSNGYVGERAMEFYGDDGSYSPSVSVRDDDDDTDNDVANVNVANTKPKVAVDGAYIKGNLTLRVAGERWHNVELWLYQSGELYGYMNVTRGVSTPQTETISDITFDLTEEWEVYAEYTPEDDPENGQPNGANPAWLILDFEGGAYRWIQHPFNVVRPDTHEWEVPLNQYFFKPECLQAPDIDQCYGNPIVHFPYKVYDQGADDLTVNWTFTDSYREEVFPASGFPNFVEDELTFTPAEMGDFNVTVTDDDGASKKIVIKMEDGLIENIAPEVEACGDVTGVEDTAVSFTGDVSDSIGETDFDYNWYFGEGSTANTLDSNHTYQFSHKYPVLLTAKDSSDAEGFDLAWASIDNAIPTADFNAPSSVNEDGIFTMDASLSSDTVSDEPYLEYEWDMGDGTKEYGINPEHIYSLAGTYTVKLTVRDDDGAEDTLEKQITVNNVAPEAYAGPDLTVYGPETEITLRGEGEDTFSDRASLDYTWEIDGITLTGREIKYTFTESNTYTVYLTVEDDDGHTAQDNFILRAAIDTDIDSLTDEHEDGIGTNSNKWDSDFDDIADYWEIYTYSTDPSNLDSDNDDAPDWFEISYMGYNVDTDNDGLVNPWDWDSDGDLISDGDEIEIDQETDEVSIITNPLVYNDPIDIETGYEGIKVLEECKMSVIVNSGRKSGAEQGVTDIGIDILETSPPQELPSRITPVFDITPSSSIENGIVKKKVAPEAVSDYSDLRWYKYTPDGWKILSGGMNTGGPNSEHKFVWGQFDSFSKVTIADASEIDSDGDGLSDATESEGSAQFYNLGGINLPYEIKDIQTYHADLYVRMKKGTSSERKVQLQSKSWHPGSVYSTSWEYTLQEDYRWYALRYMSSVTGSLKFISDNPNDILIDKVYVRDSPADRPPTDPNNPDCDEDGLSDGEEFENQKIIEFESGVEFNVTNMYEEKTVLSSIGPIGWPKEAEISLKFTPPDDTNGETLYTSAWQKTDPLSYPQEEPSINGIAELKGGDDPVTVTEILEGDYLSHLHYEYDWVVAVHDGSWDYNVTVSDYKLTVETHQNPLSKDSDGDGSYDQTEKKFQKNNPSADPLLPQKTLVNKIEWGPFESTFDVVYPFMGNTSRIARGSFFDHEIKKAGSNEPPWAPLAGELAPHLVYEDMNQEFPTSIFFDEDRDMSNNGIPETWPDGSSRSYPYGDIILKDIWVDDYDSDVITDVEVDRVYITDFSTDCGEFYGDPGDPITWVGSEVNIGSVNFDSPYSSFPYWASATFDIVLKVKYEGNDYYDYLTQTVTTDEAEIDLIDQDTYVFDSSLLEMITPNGDIYLDFQMEGDITSIWSDIQPTMGERYYQKSLSQKKEATCVYMQAYEKDDLLGIQYWFYYPFHDDPSGDVAVSKGAVHHNDWWYFWVVYDTDSKGPTKAIYDFHHNLRAIDWNSNVIDKDGLHPRVYIDAGGHRSMYGPGDDITWVDAGLIHTFNMYSELEPLNEDGDETFGAMIKYLATGGTYSQGSDYGKNLADWRYEGSANGDWDEGETLNVENYDNWVWIYDVDDSDNIKDSKGKRCNKVFYTGDNIYNENEKHLFPSKNTHLPWSRKRVSFGTEYTDDVISTTCMVWSWKVFMWDYDVWNSKEGKYFYYYNNQIEWDPWYTSPTIFTKYADGSGPLGFIPEEDS